MKLVYYGLATLLGAMGILSLLRSAELLFLGRGPFVTQFLIGLALLLVAGASLKKARSISP